MRARPELVEALDGMFEDHHAFARPAAAGPIDFLGTPDHRARRAGRRVHRAIPAAWGIDADGATGPGAGDGEDAAVLPAATPAG